MDPRRPDHNRPHHGGGLGINHFINCSPIKSNGYLSSSSASGSPVRREHADPSGHLHHYDFKGRPHDNAVDPGECPSPTSRWSFLFGFFQPTHFLFLIFTQATFYWERRMLQVYFNRLKTRLKERQNKENHWSAVNQGRPNQPRPIMKTPRQPPAPASWSPGSPSPPRDSGDMLSSLLLLPPTSFRTSTVLFGSPAAQVRSLDHRFLLLTSS